MLFRSDAALLLLSFMNLAQKLHHHQRSVLWSLTQWTVLNRTTISRLCLCLCKSDQSKLSDLFWIFDSLTVFGDHREKPQIRGVHLGWTVSHILQLGAVVLLTANYWPVTHTHLCCGTEVLYRHPFYSYYAQLKYKM